MNEPVRAGSQPVGALLVDARPVDHPTARQRGIGRYVTGLLRGLVEIDAPIVALYGSELEAEVLADVIPASNLRPWSPQAVRDHADPGTWYVATQLMLHPIPLDPIPRAVTEAGLPVAAVMYDVIPYRFPEQYQVEASARRQAQLRAPLARTCDALLAISRFAAETAAQELDYPLDRIAMIGAGVEPQFAPATSRPLPRPGRVLPADVGRYVVAVTGGDERKNTEGLLRGWGDVDPAIRSTHHLVIATAHSPSVLRRWEGWATDFGVADRVVFTGAIDDDEMVAILQGARLAVMPSLEEGFGLPVVEAAACGTPVICSSLSSLPEVLDEPAACFDPRDRAAIAAAIERALTDDDHRRVLLTAGAWAASRWTWERVARDTVDALATLGPRWQRPIRSPRRRLAVAGPALGSGSAIGAYDERVVAALDALTGAPEIVLFVDSSGTSTPTGRAAASPIERWPVRSLGRYHKPWDVDDVVAVLGSSPHHVATVELVGRVPCHVWLHEASLVGVHLGLAHASGSERWAVDRVREVAIAAESSDVLATLSDSDLLDAPLLDGLGVTLLRPVLDRARSVIVSSDRAAATVRRLRPDGPPLLVLPLASPAVDVARRTPPAAGGLVVVGWLAANKAPLVALDVLDQLSSDHDATLTFVGPTTDEAADAVESAARRLGLTDRVTISGRVDDETYRARLLDARVGVQLRAGDRGEMSAAVVDLLAHGVPTVTNLSTAGPSSPGLRVVDLDVDALVAAISTLLTDDAAWVLASADALSRAAAWTFDDVARELLRWLDDVDDLDPATIRRVGPSLASPASDG